MFVPCAVRISSLCRFWWNEKADERDVHKLFLDSGRRDEIADVRNRSEPISLARCCGCSLVATARFHQLWCLPRHAAPDSSAASGRLHGRRRATVVACRCIPHFHRELRIDDASIRKAEEALTSNEKLLSKWCREFAKVGNKINNLATAIDPLDMHKLFLDSGRRDEIADAWNRSVPTLLVRRISLSRHTWCIEDDFTEVFYREKHYDVLWEQVSTRPCRCARF